MDLSELLTGEGAALFERHMSVRDAKGQLITSQHEVTRRMLALLATRTGGGTQEGDGLHIGRDTVLPLIIDALIGPDPDGDAWLAAIAKGSFDLSIGKSYGKVSVVGPPGTYLPRLVQRWDAERTKHNASPSQLKRYRTALGILIASVLLKEMKNATNPKAALGASWPVMRAISHRQYAALRRDLAQFGTDGSFLAHLAEAVAAAVEDWKRSHEPPVKLTNKAVAASVPPGVDTADYFARQASTDKRREDALVAFGEAMLGGDPPTDDAARRAMVRLQTIPAYAEVTRLVRQDVSSVTAYLDIPASTEADHDLGEHHRRLRLLMPICAGPATVEQIIGRAVLAASFTDREHDADAINVTGSKLADAAAAQTAKRVLTYAKLVGPPPRGVPLDHFAWFEVCACYLAFDDDWPARERWREVGLMPADANKSGHARLHRELFGF